VDTAWALLRRAKGRAGLTLADKGHLHHRLIRLGHGQRRAVLILWAWTGLLSAAVLVPVYTGDSAGLIPLGVAAVALLLYTVMAPGWDARRANGNGHAQASDPPDPWRVPDWERDQPTR
jgi:UDP-GlcNAc:undecaprenyl-phosphate GlcNAc-1-phosphate transferase